MAAGEQSGGPLAPIAPQRVAEELVKLSGLRTSGALEPDAYEHRFARMVSELRDRRISGSRAEILEALQPLLANGTVLPHEWERLIKQLGLA